MHTVDLSAPSFLEIPTMAVNENTDPKQIRAQILDLRAEHRDLDDVIDRVTDEAPFDQLRVKRLKKRKLALKDQISTLENMLLPDIIA